MTGVVLAGSIIPDIDCQCWGCRSEWLRSNVGAQYLSAFIVCSECGNKRCPHADDCRNECTGSNEPGQQGSFFA